jgi:Putative bacterial sensory transduction regulator
MFVKRSLKMLAMVAVAVVLAGPVAAQTRDRITAEQLTGLLKDKGIEGQVNERGNVIAQSNGSKIVFFISGQTLQAYFGLTGTSANVTTINDWNKSKRFGRAYIDADGDPCVELDYDLEGGVTDDNIKVWFDTVTAIVRSFRTHVSSK